MKQLNYLFPEFDNDYLRRRISFLIELNKHKEVHAITRLCKKYSIHSSLVELMSQLNHITKVKYVNKRQKAKVIINSKFNLVAALSLCKMEQLTRQLTNRGYKQREAVSKVLQVIKNPDFYYGMYSDRCKRYDLDTRLETVILNYKETEIPTSDKQIDLLTIADKTEPVKDPDITFPDQSNNKETDFSAITLKLPLNKWDINNLPKPNQFIDVWISRPNSSSVYMSLIYVISHEFLENVPICRFRMYSHFEGIQLHFSKTIFSTQQYKIYRWRPVLPLHKTNDTNKKETII